MGGVPRRRDRTQALTFADVRRFALALPDVEESTMYGAPAMKLHGRLLACMASHKSAEPGTLVVCVDFDDRDELIAAEPAVYYTKEHYIGYASVLVRLSRIHSDALRDLLLAAHRFVSTKPRRTRRPRRAGRS